MRKITFTILCLLPMAVMAQDKFDIAGKLSGVETEKKVILSYINSEGKSVNDSTMVKGGKFFISGTTAFGNKAYLSLVPVDKDTTKKQTATDYTDFYLEKGHYKVLGTDSLSKAKITGTKVQSDYLEFKAQTDELLTQFKEITQRFTKVWYAKVKDTIAIKAIQAEARPVHAKIEAKLDSFILSHPDSYVSVDLITENKTAVINPAVFEPFYKVLTPRVLNGFAGKKLTDKYEKAKQISIGKKVDFTQNDDEGNIFQLSSLKGKYVLVDFWASWCVPCRAENPNLLKAYHQLKDKNFEIVGISLDETKAAWLNAVKHDGMPWIQVSDLKGFKNEVALRFGISAIPQNFLINPEGVIIAKDLRGEDVNEKIAALIK